ncbi:hypothetical protein Trad_1015 [Truepera radiovictrix DSM 17093]|uniref:Uncharacterized protein n=1 Tax=Truepera radiovictrix (strain DSM 17093 / CIP 108686 / LMG 22925 / RQ-24) TaxID=649638 RepID=D7CVB4_TRURR|nr:hypothetical protein [Truepera radiovictrix]ADI14142.1 hypothetical protein Trad_1015 [Truepera radiovictrix DSM 17093]WMT57296.1 hypothetical protein RCV51_14925 [Truepera radiovictrix]
MEGALRLALLLNRPLLLSYLVAVPTALYLLTLMSDVAAERWLVLEVLFIPLGVVFSADTFLGRYERGELELLLARRSARALFVCLVAPSVALLLLGSGSISLLVSQGGPLAALARAALLLGATHLLLVLTRSRPFALSLFGLWWLTGFAFMVPWVEAAPTALLLLHPMRLSGGGAMDAGLEGATLLVGVGSFVAAWWAVGRAKRWVT